MATTALDHPSGNLRGAVAPRLRTAFVLSGGASLGALQVGMLQALYEHDIVPDVLVGTSAGAFNAAFVASRPQSTETARALGRVWRNLQREDIFPVSISALVGGLRGRRDHLVPARGLRRLAQRYVPFDDLTDAPIPLHVAAFDLARYSPEVELIVLPAPNPCQVQPTSFEHAARLMTDARIATREVLARRGASRHLRLAG